MFHVVYSGFSGYSFARDFSSFEMAELYALVLMDGLEFSYEILIIEEGGEVVASYLHEQ